MEFYLRAMKVVGRVNEYSREVALCVWYNHELSGMRACFDIHVEV